MPNKNTSSTHYSSTGITSCCEIGREAIGQWVRSFADLDTLRMLDTDIHIGYERLAFEKQLDAELARVS